MALLAATLLGLGVVAPATAASRAKSHPRAADRAVAVAAPFFRSPTSDGLRESPGRRRAAAELDFGAAGEADPFGGDGGAASDIEPGAGLTTSGSFATAAEPERRLVPTGLERPAGGFNARVSGRLPGGFVASTSVEADERYVTHTAEVKRDVRRELAGGRAITTTLELGWAREARVSPDLRASFAPADSRLARRSDVSPSGRSVWVNLKTTYQLAPTVSLFNELEHDRYRQSRETLIFFGVNSAW